MSITTAGDNLIHYEALGRGRPLIFIHGWIGSWRYWWPSMQALSSHYRTFALDLLGFGDSSKAPDQYAVNDYVKLLADFVERLGMAEPVILVGHGLGAAVALRYAGVYPRGVSHVAAVSLPVRGEALNQRSLVGDRATIINRATDRAGSFPELEVEARKTDPGALTALLEEARGANFSSELQTVGCPVLMVYGENDPVVQIDDSLESIVNPPRADRALVTLPASMHFPMLEETAKFNRLLLEFMRAGDDVSALTPKEYWKRRTH